MNYMTIPILIFATGFLLDLLFGEPRSPLYPVSLYGRFASIVELLCRFQFGNGVMCGLLAWIVAVSAIVWAVFFLTWLTTSLFWLVGVLLAGACFYYSITMRSMLEASIHVRKSLDRKDLYGARFALSQFVNRNTDQLTESGILSMGIEGIGENLLKNWNSVCFWSLFGFYFAGVPGCAAGAVFARAVSTLDLCWGYRTEQYRKFGKTAARIDDVIQWIPARLTILTIAVSALFLKLSPFGTVRTVWKYRKPHPSPNTGLVFTALSGALGVRIEETENHLEIGSEYREMTSSALGTAEHLALLSGLLFTTILLGVCLCLLKN